MSIDPSIDHSYILITCAPATAEALCIELQRLNYTPIEKSELFVTLEGTFYDCIKLNLHLRTAYRILFKLTDFEARNFDLLYKQINKMPWERWIPADSYLSVDSRTSQREDVRDTRFPNLKVKDAIVDRINDKCGRRPDSGPDLSGCSVFLYWKGNDATIYLDTTGEPLYRRGYRTHVTEAPLQESLAANILMNTRWKMDTNLINPMCGSGTLAIEAALMASNVAPGLHGRNFAFRHFSFFVATIWESLCEEAKKAIIPTLPIRIIATDHDKNAIKAARSNAEKAGVDHLIEFDVCDFTATELPEENKGIVILNPEYGMRLGDMDELLVTYKSIGDFFKQRCKGFTGYIFTGNQELAKNIGLKTKRKIPFFNGKIECRLLEFELYDGSKRVVETRG